MAFTELTFSPVTGWNDTTSFPTTPADESATRERLQELHDQTRVAFNGLLDELEATTDGASGANQIGATAISGWTGGDVQTILESAKTAFDELVAGEVDPSSILTPGAIDNTDMLADDVVTGAKIAAEAIDSEHYVDGSIDPEHLANAAVTEAKIDSGAVTVNKIGTGAVTEAKIGTGAVTKAKLHADALDWTAIITDENIGYAGGSVATTAHVGKSEMLIQLKQATGTSAFVYGSTTVPLQSDGTPVAPPIISCPDSSYNYAYRKVYPTATAIAYLTYAPMQTQYLSVFVR